VIASQSGIADHLKLGTQAMVGAKSGVMRDVGDKETVLGVPAAPHREYKRQVIAQQQLPELIRRMKQLENKVEELSARLASSGERV
jgi:UDP-3-O-[3-hydroxymyristoyl] glucosamine N-acyltransferase